VRRSVRVSQPGDHETGKTGAEAEPGRILLRGEMPPGDEIDAADGPFALIRLSPGLYQVASFAADHGPFVRAANTLYEVERPSGMALATKLYKRLMADGPGGDQWLLKSHVTLYTHMYRH
jgi:hypothetical protein